MGPRLERATRFFAVWLGRIHTGECPTRQSATTGKLHRLFYFLARRLRRASPARHWTILLGQLYSVAREVTRRGISGCFPRGRRGSSESRLLPPSSGIGRNSRGDRTKAKSRNGRGLV